ncbi:MAG: RNA 2',3'-cyclic phosphodiesterase [Minisyncoccales bacterium]
MSKENRTQKFQEDESEKIRCFISINIPEDIADKVKDIQDKLPEFNGKKTEKGNLHLTLKFLGEISREEVDKIREILRSIEFSKFDLEADELGVFSPRFIKIIWLHLLGAEELQKKIDKENN